MDRRVALSTGGAKGIGRAVALDLAAAGWNVAVCYRTSDKEAAEVAAAAEKSGVGALALRCDVSDPEAAVAMVRRVEKEWGRIDALVNRAGPYYRVELLKETVEGWRSLIRHNLHPAFYLNQPVVPRLPPRHW